MSGIDDDDILFPNRLVYKDGKGDRGNIEQDDDTKDCTP